MKRCIWSTLHIQKEQNYYTYINVFIHIFLYLFCINSRGISSVGSEYLLCVPNILVSNRHTEVCKNSFHNYFFEQNTQGLRKHLISNSPTQSDTVYKLIHLLQAWLVSLNKHLSWQQHLSLVSQRCTIKPLGRCDFKRKLEKNISYHLLLHPVCATNSSEKTLV